MSRAGRPSAQPRPIRATTGNLRQSLNALTQPCRCGKPRTIKLDGAILSILCSDCGTVALRVRMRDPKAAAEVWAQATGQPAGGREPSDAVPS